MDTYDNMAFSTLHDEFKRALTAMGVQINIIDASVNSKNLKKVCEKYAIHYEGKPLNSDILRTLEGAFTYTRNRLDAKRYQLAIYDDLEIGPTIVDAMLKEWKSMRREAGCVDFEDLQEMLYEECILKGNIEVCNFLRKRYNYIYVDEFQDTSQIQYEILKVYASGVKKIVAIGDDDQTIYSWRGSYNKIITDEFAKDFKPAISKLSVNYRCPSNILNAVKPSLEQNKNRFEKELKSYNEGGLFRVGEYASYKSMADNLANMIYNDVKRNMSVAILCRVNSDGLLPALMLDRLGKFQYTISGDGMTLDSYIGRQVISIAKLFTEKSTMAVRGVLSQLTWNKYSISNIMKVCKNNKVSFWDIPDNDLTYSCPDIASTLISWKKVRREVGDIDTLKIIYRYFREVVYTKDSQYNDVCKSVISSVEAILEMSRVTTVEDFLDELEEINDRLKARKKKFNGSNVRIATVHEYKGKEADSVYIWNDSEDVFPHKNCNEQDVEELEEERRVHYIACTRARKISTIMYMKGKVGLFVQEMDLSHAEKLTPQIGGVLKAKEDNTLSEKKVEELLEDVEFTLDFKSKDEVKAEIHELSDEDKEYIWVNYNEMNRDFEKTIELIKIGLGDDIDIGAIEDYIDKRVLEERR